MRNNYNLYDICDYVTSRTSRIENYISTENMLPNKGGVCTPSNVPSGAAVEYKVGDILISNIRPYFQKIWQADCNGACSADVLCIRANNKADSKYLYYLLSQQLFFDYVMSGAKGCKMPRGDKKQIMQWQISLPPLEEQRRIAGILGAIDDKIENNRRINTNLELQAQALYKQWFVDFEFPNEDGKPYKSSGGKMVDSELGQIPEGWRVVSLDEMTSKFGTGLNPRQNFKLGEGDNYYVTIKNMRDNRVYLDDKCDKVTDEAIEKINKRSKLQKGDLLFSGIGTIGRVAMLTETPTNWNTSESIFNMHPKEEFTTEFLYVLLLSETFQEYVKIHSQGGVQQGIRMASLKQYKMAIPAHKTLKIFDRIVVSIISQIRIRDKETDCLVILRDTLLPKLMNVEIKL